EKGFELLASAVRSEKPDIRAAAASGLAASRNVRSMPLLAPLIKDADSLVRMDAIHALAKLKQPEGIPLLLMALADQDQFLRNEAGNAISRFGQDAIPQLIQAIRNDGQTRQVAAHALAQMNSAAVKPLLELLKDTQSDTRAAASEALSFATLRQPLDA